MTERLFPAVHRAGPYDLSVIPYGLWLAVALGALLIWRIGALYFAQTELFFDEAQYWAWSEELDFGYYSKPPFIAWLIRAGTEVCGSDSEFCVRITSPFVHTATSLVVFLLGRRLYDARTGFWAAIVFATLPGITFSAGLISTDVPLLFFWACALLAFSMLLERQSWGAAIALGAALGFGVLSKYAMLYFILCAVIYALWDRRARKLVTEPKIYMALIIAALIVTPNVLWNAQHQFATLSHTADNAKWSGSMFNLSSAIEFFAAQMGVFGVILFAALLWAAYRAWRVGTDSTQRYLLAFSVPVILLITLQAFLSRAHANWAAVAYVAAAVLVTAELLSANRRRLFAGSLALHTSVIALLGIGNAFAGQFVIPGGIDPYERVLGWKEIARIAEKRALDGGYKAIAADKRALTAEFIYYVRNGIPVLSLRDGKPSDHFELTRPITKASGDPILLVSFRGQKPKLEKLFDSVQLVGTESIKTGMSGGRTVYFYRLEGYKQ